MADQGKLPAGRKPRVDAERNRVRLLEAAKSAFAEKGAGAQPWSVQVDRVDPGDVGLEPSFGAAIYENLLEELAKTEQFKLLFRSGDRNANDVPSLLILKTTVQKYTPGSETRRAVTTVNGATKLNVRVQLVTREGHVVLEKVVDGNVRFIGGNLRATHNLAHNVALTLKQSTLPEQAELVLRTPGVTAQALAEAVMTTLRERGLLEHQDAWGL